MPEEDKVRGLSPYDLRRILGDETLAGTKLLGKKSDGTFENVKTDDEGRLLVYDPKVGSLISYSGITTADGAPGGLTLVDDVLITKPDFNGNLVIITSGDYEGQARDINGITTAGTVTPLSAFDGQILEETTFVIVALRFTPAEVAAVLILLGNVFGLVNALLTLTETGGTVTTTGPGNEDNAYINNAPAGVFEPRVVKINFTNQTAAETVVVRTYHRDEALGGWIKDDEETFTGVQDPLSKNIDLEPNRFGIKVTIERTAGAAKAYKWEVFYEV